MALPFLFAKITKCIMRDRERRFESDMTKVISLVVKRCLFLLYKIHMKGVGFK